MGNKESSLNFDLKKHSELWEKLECTRDVDTLKKELSSLQFGKDTSECKLVWLQIRVDNEVPFLIVPETRISELEDCVIPEAYNKLFPDLGFYVEKVRLVNMGNFGNQSFLNQGDFYEKTKENSRLFWVITPSETIFCLPFTFCIGTASNKICG